ncbi:MAG TPA: biotin--[acetyl-CoA-carboxylase] ligase, partial [Chitinophagaceae bacterium]
MPLTPVNHSIGDPFIELQSIDSTNNYALSEIHANLAVAGACYFAHHQTAGRGQRGNQWSSGLDANLAMSVAVQPSLGIHEQFLLSCQVALAIRDVLEKIAGEGFRVKWP